MLDVVQVASYVCDRYMKGYGYRIDELKLHKLLYFIQRECLILFQKPMFSEHFRAWRYGPVIPKIRQLYAINQLRKTMSCSMIQKYKSVFDYVFENYAGRKSTTLSDITHGQVSWINARRGVAWDENSNHLLLLTDIKKDAERAVIRRELIRKMRQGV